MLDLEIRLSAWKENGELSDPVLLSDLQIASNSIELPWSSALAFAGIELMTGEWLLEPLFHDGETRAQQLAKPRPNDIAINQALLVASPNPTNDFVTITIPEGFEQLGLKLHIFNTLGALVHELVIAQNITLIDCSQWANGLYTMRALVNDHLSLTGKLIKQ